MREFDDTLEQGANLPGIDALALNLINRVNVGDIATRAAEIHGERTAIVDGGRDLSFREFNRLTNRVGHALLDQGLQPGDVVALMARNCAEMLISYFACAKTGLICAPVNLGLRPEEIAYCLRDSNARILIAQSALAHLASGLPEQVDSLQAVYWIGDPPAGAADSPGFESLTESGQDTEPEVCIDDRAPVQLLYTSGTTARPKGVLSSHLAITMSALSSALTNRMTSESTTLVALPLFHCALLNGRAVPGFVVGAASVLTDGFDAQETAVLIERHRVRTLVLLPMMYGQLLVDASARERDFSSVTRACYAMAPMPEERLRAIRERFPNADLVLGSGQTEFTPPTAYQQPEHQWEKAASWGPATAMTRIGIMDDAGVLLPRGETGEIVYRGPQVMNGYLNKPGETTKAFRHGWFHSGDMGWLDGEGVLWFTDRKKDVIKSGGENLASIEVERCLMEHPDVAEAAVIGLPHPRWGEAVTAAVVLRAGAEANEVALQAHCRERLAGFKVPKAIRFRATFPRTGTGKIQKHVLRQELEDLYQDEPPSASAEESG